MNRFASTGLIIALCCSCAADKDDEDTAGTVTESATTDPTTGDTNDPTTGDTNDPTTGDTSDPTTGDTSDPTTGDTSDPTTGEAGPPTINSVTWTQAEGCAAGVGSDVTIVVDVTDPDNDVADLTFGGSVIGCSPTSIEAAETTVLCPQAADYQANVTVTDPDGNSDEIEFTIPVCEDGTAP